MLTLLVELIDLYNIGMFESCGCSRLLQKARLKVGIIRQIRPHNLDSHRPVEIEVDSAKDLSHAPSIQWSLNAILSEGLTHPIQHIYLSNRSLIGETYIRHTEDNKDSNFPWDNQSYLINGKEPDYAYRALGSMAKQSQTPLKETPYR